MLPISFILAVLALLGHFALCIGLYNRAHSTAWPCWVVSAASLPIVAVAVSAPPLLAWHFAHGAPLVPDRPVAWAFAPLAYLGLCWVMSLVAVPIWFWRRGTDRTAQALVSNDTYTIDLDPRSVGDLATALLARVPGNEIFSLCVHEKTLLLPRLSPELDGLTVVHLSDLHFTGQLKKSFFDEIVDHANQLDADIVALTGDLIDKDRCVDWIPETLGRLRSRFGTYFVLGNHETRLRDVPRLRRTLTESGLVDLGARWLGVTIRGESVVLAGNELPWIAPAADVENCPPRGEDGRPLRIVLSHTPDHFDWARTFDFDLMLAGHTHGGQICPPLIGPIVSPSRYGVRWIAGAFYEEPTLLHVSRGISGTRPIRINSPPELAKLVLKAATVWQDRYSRDPETDSAEPHSTRRA